MKKLYGLLLMLCLSSFLLVTSCLADLAKGESLDPIDWPEEAIGQVVVLKDGTYLREGGSTNYNIMKKASKGEVYFVTGTSSSNWYAVELTDGKTAYVSPKMVEFTERLNIPIRFNDPTVEARIRMILGTPSGSITPSDMETITSFSYDAINDSSADGTITDISALQHCINLRELDISNQPIKSIEPLRNLESLETVTLHGCRQITDVSPLGGKAKLSSVWLNGVPVSDVSMILSLPSLRFFNASWGTHITDISALSQTSNLTSFYLDREVADFSPLLNHKNMQSVHLAGVSRDMFASLIRAWPKLADLEVDKAPITGQDLYLLKDLAMSVIQLNQCPIGDIAALSTQTALDDLRLMYCGVTDVSPLADLTNITYCIDLRGNDIPDISPLLGLTDLKSLYVSSTGTYTLEALEALMPATRVSITD